MKNFKYYDLILGAYVCILLCANLIGPAKLTTIHVPVIGSVTFLAGVLFFPISYLFGDILTEVYGYARDRRVVWSGFAALVFAAFMATVVVQLPPAEGWKNNQPAVRGDFGNTPRIVIGLDHRFLVRLVRQQLRDGEDEDLDQRALAMDPYIGSTLCGELVDSALFYTIAFAGRWETAAQLVAVTLTQYVLKSGWEILATPLTYWVVGSLKRVEHEDYYDRHTNFTPFSLKA